MLGQPVQYLDLCLEGVVLTILDSCVDAMLANPKTAEEAFKGASVIQGTYWNVHCNKEGKMVYKQAPGVAPTDQELVLLF